MNADSLAATAANARGLDALIVTLLVFAVAVGIAILLRDSADLSLIRGRAAVHARRLAPAWVADTVLAGGIVAYVLLGTIPMLRHMHFLYNTYPLSGVVAVLGIAVGFLAVLLAFLI
jgi:hypothetical protein